MDAIRFGHLYDFVHCAFWKFLRHFVLIERKIDFQPGKNNHTNGYKQNFARHENQTQIQLVGVSIELMIILNKFFLIKIDRFILCEIHQINRKEPAENIILQ